MTTMEYDAPEHKDCKWPTTPKSACAPRSKSSSASWTNSSSMLTHGTPERQRRAALAPHAVAAGAGAGRADRGGFLHRLYSASPQRGHAGRGSQVPRRRLPTVTVVAVERSPANSTLVLPGNIQAVTEAPVLARASGYIKRRYVDIGDRVKAGQLLAEIEAPELDQQVHQAQAALEQARRRARTGQRQSAAGQSQRATGQGDRRALEEAGSERRGFAPG